MKTPAKKSCVFCLTPVHHMSVLRVLVREMQLEAFWGNWAPFLKCNYRGNRGRPWENSDKLQRYAWICGDLWGAVESLQRAVEIAGVSSTSYEIRRKFTSDFRELHNNLVDVFL